MARIMADEIKPEAPKSEAAPQPPAPEKEQMGALYKEIDALLGDPDDHIPLPNLPRGAKYVWGWVPDSDGKVTTIITGEPWPFTKTQTVIAMFQDETEVRVYTLGNVPNKPPTRYTLAKAAPSIFAETMPYPIFKAELAAEFQALEEETVEPEDFEPDEEEPKPPNGEAPKPVAAS